MNRATFVMAILITVASMSASTVLFSSPVIAAADINDALCGPGKSAVGTPYCDEVEAADEANKSATSNVLVGPDGIITNIVDALSYVVGIIALIMIIIAGFMFIFSSGNPESAGRATKTVIYAVIGLVVALSAQMIVIFVLSRL